MKTKQIITISALTLFLFTLVYLGSAASNMEPHPVLGDVSYFDGTPAIRERVKITNLDCLDMKTYQPVGYSKTTNTDSSGTYQVEMSNFDCLVFDGQRIKVESMGMERTVSALSGPTRVDLFSGQVTPEGETLPIIAPPEIVAFTVKGRVRMFEVYHFTEQDVTITNLATNEQLKDLTEDGYYSFQLLDLPSDYRYGDTIQVEVCEQSEQCIKTFVVLKGQSSVTIDFDINDKTAEITWYGIGGVIIFLIIARRWFKGWWKGIYKYWRKLFPSRGRKMARTVAKRYGR